MPDDDEKKNKTLLGSIPIDLEQVLRTRHHLSAAHYASIGMIAAKWAEFEHEIQLIIWHVANIDYLIGACITSQIGNSGRLLDSLIALMQLKGADKEHLKALRVFAEKIGKKQRRRNRLVHDPWYFETDGDKLVALRMEITAAKSLIYEPVEETTVTLNTFAQEIGMLGDELQNIIRSRPLGAPRSSSFEKHI